MTGHWTEIHAVLWCLSAGMVWCAIQAESEWVAGFWLKARPWYIRWCVASAIFFAYTAGTMVPR